MYQSEVLLDLAVHTRHYSRHVMVDYNPSVMSETSIVLMTVEPKAVQSAVVIGPGGVEAHPVTPNEKGRS